VQRQCESSPTVGLKSIHLDGRLPDLLSYFQSRPSAAIVSIVRDVRAVLASELVWDFLRPQATRPGHIRESRRPLPELPKATRLLRRLPSPRTSSRSIAPLPLTLTPSHSLPHFHHKSRDADLDDWFRPAVTRGERVQSLRREIRRVLGERCPPLLADAEVASRHLSSQVPINALR